MILYDRQHILSIVQPFNLLVPLLALDYYRESDVTWGYDICLHPHNDEQLQVWNTYIHSNGLGPLPSEFNQLIIIGLKPDDYLNKASHWFSRDWAPVPEGPH